MATYLDAPPSRGRRSWRSAPTVVRSCSTTTLFIALRRSQLKYQRELEAAASAKAEQLAAELTRKKNVQLEQLQRRMREQQEKFTEERTRHAEALREQRAKLRDEAEREAAKKVRADLLKKERLITGSKSRSTNRVAG